MSKNKLKAYPSGTAGTHGFEQGMDLRDFFAGQALQGWLASFEEGANHPGSASDRADSIARLSYVLADAMMKAR